MEALLAALAKNEVFSKVKQEDLELLAQSSISRTLRAGEYLCHQGDDWPKVLFVESGEFCWALISPGGKERILFTIKPRGRFLGSPHFRRQTNARLPLRDRRYKNPSLVQG